MFVPLAAAALAFGLASASSQVDNTTGAQTSTVVSAVSAIASSDSYLESSRTEVAPPTYTATGSVPTYGKPGTTTFTDDAPTTTTGPDMSSSSLASGIVHTENSQDGTTTDRYYSEIISKPPRPIFLSSYTTAAHPTLPPVYSSPIRLTKQSSAAHPTLPVSQAQQTTTSTIEPLIVHTERPAQSLALPSSKTYGPPSHGTTKPAVPVPGGDGNGEGPHPNNMPSKIYTVPTTMVTVAPGSVVTMGGYQSTINEQGSAQPAMTTIPDQVMTMTGGEVVTIPAAVYTLPVLSVSMSESPSTQVTSSSVAQTSSSDAPSGTAQPGGGDEGSGDFEGASSKAEVGWWRYSLLGMAVGAVVII